MKTTNTECPFGLNSYHFLIVNLFTYNCESKKCMKEIFSCGTKCLLKFALNEEIFLLKDL